MSSIHDFFVQNAYFNISAKHSALPGNRLLLHQQFKHLVEVEGQVGRLYGLALELGMRPGGVIMEELVPVMSEVQNWRNIRGHNRAQETQHFVRECDSRCDTETNVMTSVVTSVHCDHGARVPS